MDATETKRFVDRINELEAELSEVYSDLDMVESQLTDAETNLQVAVGQLAITAREQKYAIVAEEVA